MFAGYALAIFKIQVFMILCTKKTKKQKKQKTKNKKQKKQKKK